jgi:hypothetical protein
MPDYNAFNRLSDIMDVILDKIGMAGYKAFIVRWMWQNPGIVEGIDKKIREVYHGG